MTTEYIVAVAALALVLDFTFGDPRNRLHPTAWMGNLLARLVPPAQNCKSILLQKLGGALVVVAVVFAVVAVAAACMLAATLIPMMLFDAVWPATAATIILGGILLKSTIAVRGMERHALAVAESLERNDIDTARKSLSMIVKRKTGNLDNNHVISGVIESVGENTVDGVTGPLFYYGLFGLPGAFMYRVVNTADSMIGYKTQMFQNVGWFAARYDSVLNYLPSRLTALVMVMAAAILRNDWRQSYHILMRDGARTSSLNAGYPMAALAGALGVRLEKVNHYSLGGRGVCGDDVNDVAVGNGDDTTDCRHANSPTNNRAVLTGEHIHSAILLMKVTSIIFFGLVSVPMIVTASLASSWLLGLV